MLFNHWSEVPQNIWRWRYFTPQEIASRGDGSILINFDALDKLEKARLAVGKPFVINSAYRDPIHNARVGGAPLSQHKTGGAFDISIKAHDKYELVQVCKSVGFNGFGHYNTFLHVDNREHPAQWGNK